MGFGAIVRAGVALAHTLTSGDDGLQVEVTHRAWVDQDIRGDGVFDPPLNEPANTLTCFYSDKSERIERNGIVLEVKSKLTFLNPVQPNGAAGRNEPIDNRDIITLPGGKTGPIVAVDGFADSATGQPYVLKVYMGASK